MKWQWILFLLGSVAFLSHWHFTLPCDYYSTFSLSLNIWLLFSEPQRRITNTFEWEKDMTRNKKLTFGKRGKENNGKLKKNKTRWLAKSKHKISCLLLPSESAVCCYPLNQLFAATLWNQDSCHVPSTTVCVFWRFHLHDLFPLIYIFLVKKGLLCHISSFCLYL